MQDVTLDILKGESVGIIGRNGAGKSTFLQLVCGTLRPSTGSIEVEGRIAAMLELGAGFNPELSGADNIVFNGAMLGFRRSEMLAKAAGIYEFTGLREFAEMPLKYYSSGMYMKLAFAIATEVDLD